MLQINNKDKQISNLLSKLNVNKKIKGDSFHIRLANHKDKNTLNGQMINL